MTITSTIPVGAKCLTPRQACEKLARRKSWLWDRIKSDPTFPRPIYLSSKGPVLIEQDIDEWLGRLRQDGAK